MSDFGIIKEEKGPVSTVFEVENTGNKPLLIVDISVSCGCTSTDYTKRPIAPGKKGKIKVNAYSAKSANTMPNNIFAGLSLCVKIEASSLILIFGSKRRS